VLLIIYDGQFITSYSNAKRQSAAHVTIDSTIAGIRGCIQKFPDWVDNEIYA